MGPRNPRPERLIVSTSPIVRCFGLRGHGAKVCDSADQIALQHVRPPEDIRGSCEREPVTDRIRKFAPSSAAAIAAIRSPSGRRPARPGSGSTSRGRPMPGRDRRFGEIRLDLHGGALCRCGLSAGGQHSATSAGSSSSRAIGRTLRAGPCFAAPRQRSQGGLSASTRARTASATSSLGRPGRSSRCRTSRALRGIGLADPQRLQRRRELRARSMSPVSRLQPNAARRLSIRFRPARAPLIVGAARRVEPGGHRRVVVAVTRSDGVGFAGLAELFQRVLAHGFQQPVSRSAAGVFGHHQRLVDQQGELVEHLVALHSSAPATARAASRSNPPRNTASRRNRTRSVSVSSACDQSTEARNVCWRRTAVRAPPVSSRKRSCRLSTISSSDNARTRAAASSIASGMPSRRRQISATDGGVVVGEVKSGRARRARSANSSMASSASDSDGTRQVASPATPMRLAAGGQQRQPGAGTQQGVDQRGAGVEQVLAVVQHQQHLAIAE